ncbi:ParB family protein [Emiliania huxleyi virus PS401]|nr:ParB family protein [Emiliania huxleyi virus PS401]
MQDALATYPLKSLTIHPLNPRQSVDAAEIEDLAAAIELNGLLQNLCGFIEGRAKKPGIVAGGRRLRALQLLAEQGKWDRDVPVLITRDRAQAVEWAGAENAARVGLSPAQEVRHYRDLHVTGKTVPQIARAYAVTEGHVARRMKLACLPDPVLEALEKGQITLDVAQAFTISDDEAAVLHVLGQVTGRDFRPQAVRDALTPETARGDDRRAIYVGLDAYADAGGRITPDLFTGNAILHDPKLLHRLFTEKLELEADAIHDAEGWKQVHTCYEHYIPYDTTGKLTRLYRPKIELPEADAAELEELEETPWNDRTEEMHARIKELEARERGDFSDEQIETGEIWIYVNNAGTLKRDEAYTSAKPKKTTGDSTGSGAKPEPKGLSQALIEDLRAIRTLALQVAIEDKPDLILGLAAYQIDHALRIWHRPTGMTLNSPRNMPSVDEAVTAPAWAREIAVEAGAEPDAASFRAFLAENRTIPVLARALARATDAQGTDFTRHLMEQAGADIRSLWRPTLANFLGRCPADVLDAIRDQLFPVSSIAPEALATWGAMKKKDKAEVLATLFDTTPETIKAHGLTDDMVERLDTWIPEEIA